MFRGETTSQIVIPSCDPPAKIGDLRFVKLVCGKVFVREDADASKMVQDRLQVEVGFMTMGILRWTMQDLMRPEGISSCQQQTVAFEDGQAI